MQEPIDPVVMFEQMVAEDSVKDLRKILVSTDPAFRARMLNSACFESAGQVVHALLKHVDVLDFKGGDYEGGWQPLHHAVANGDLGITRALIKAGFEVNVSGIEDNEELTPLSLAVSKFGNLASLDEERAGDPQAAKVKIHLLHLLLSHGADPFLLESASDESWINLPFLRTVNPEVQRILLARGKKSFEALRPGMRKKILNFGAEQSIRARNPESLKFMLELGADPNGTTDFNWSSSLPEAALSELRLTGQKTHAYECMTVLAENGGNFDEALLDTRISRAVRKKLAKHGVKMRRPPANVHEAIILGEFETAKDFITGGAKINSGLDKWPSPLRLAIEVGNESLALWLMEHGAKPERKNNTTLGEAAHAGFMRLVEYIVKNHNPDLRRPVGEDSPTPLIFLTLDHLEILKYLHEAGMPLDAVDSWGETALHDAAGLCNPPVVEYLLQQGLDAGALDEHGRSVLDYFRNEEIYKESRLESGRTRAHKLETRRILREYGAGE